MIDITKLGEYWTKFGKNREVDEFIEFVRVEQAKEKKSGIISLAQRDAARRLKEIKYNQESRKVLTPADDFKNLR